MAAHARQRLTVWAGGAKMWIAASSIVEVISSPRMTRAPHGPRCLLGVAHHRGEVLPVISTSDLLGVSGARPERVVVLGCGAPVGLAVDAVGALESDTTLSGPDDSRRTLENQDGTSRLDVDEALLAQFEAFLPKGRKNAPSDIDRSVVATHARSVARSFLSFWVSGQIYAVPLEAVLEVADAGDRLNAQGVARDSLEFRGSILPLITVSRMLGLAASAAESRLIVVGAGEQALALLVDQIGAVIRLDDSRVGRAPSFFNRRDGEAMIASVLRMPDGRGVVSVLSVDRLLGEGHAQPVGGRGEIRSPSPSEPSRGARSKRVLVVGLGGGLYGLPMDVVREVMHRPVRLARPPRSPANLEGVISLRGRALPVIRDWQGARVPGQPAHIIVAALGEAWAGLLVDRIVGAIDAPSHELKGMESASLVQGAFDHEGMSVSLIDPEALTRSVQADLARHADRGALPQ